MTAAKVLFSFFIAVSLSACWSFFCRAILTFPYFPVLVELFNYFLMQRRKKSQLTRRCSLCWLILSHFCHTPLLLSLKFISLFLLIFIEHYGEVCALTIAQWLGNICDFYCKHFYPRLPGTVNVFNSFIRLLGYSIHAPFAVSRSCVVTSFLLWKAIQWKRWSKV